jgi:hypothetical protein
MHIQKKQMDVSIGSNKREMNVSGPNGQLLYNERRRREDNFIHNPSRFKFKHQSNLLGS